MSGQEWVAIIGAIGAVITSILTFLVIILRKDVKDTREAVCEVKQDVVKVHKLVDGAASNAKDYEAKLIDALSRHGIKIPQDESAAPSEDSSVLPPP